MRCPNCHQSPYSPNEPCPSCQFSGDPALIEEWMHIRWVLPEIALWQAFEAHEITKERLSKRYKTRQCEIEVALGLRLPPFTREEADQAWPTCIRLEVARQLLAEWLASGLLVPEKSQGVVDRVVKQLDELHQRLQEHPRPPYPATDAERLEQVRYLLQVIDDLWRDEVFVSRQARAQARSPLLGEQAAIEVRLGLRPPPEAAVPQPPEPPAPQVEAAAEAEQVPRVIPTPVTPVPSQPAVPFGERLWRMLISERTLRVILFLGIFLLFAAAISFVIWGWKDFAPPWRVAIPTGFTILAFVLGWYVRTQISLYRLGIALSAIASLLIPVDLYSLYVHFIAAEYWFQFWLIASLFCLVAYVAVTWRIQSRLFGYLTGAAAGSAVLAGIEFGYQLAGLSRDWYSAGLSVLALGMVFLAAAIDRLSRPGRWRVFADPLRSLALLTVGVLMPLTLGWRFVERETYDALHDALTVNWWVGGLVLGWGAVYHRSRGLGVVAAFSLPVAVYLTQAAAFDRWSVNPAWHALGWACLVPLYLLVGRRLLARKDDEVVYGHGRTAIGWAIALIVVTALWSLTDLRSGAAAASSHAILVLAIGMAVWLWRRPAHLYGISLFSFTSLTFGMMELGVELSQVGVGWASLALLHLIAAVMLGGWRSARRFTLPLVWVGYVVAFLSLLPCLFPYDGTLLAYALGNWVAVTAWGARLAYLRRPGFADPEKPRTAPFHWLAACSLPFWIGVLFTNQRPMDAILALALGVLAWGMVALGYRLSRADVAGYFAWNVGGLAASVASLFVAFAVDTGGLAAPLCLLLAGVLYLVDAFVGSRVVARWEDLNRWHSFELIPAAAVIAWGWGLLLDRLPVSPDASFFAMAALVTLYIGGGLWIERGRSRIFTHRFLSPIYVVSHFVTLFALVRIYVRPLEMMLYGDPWTDTMRLWATAAQLLLGVVYGLYAWGTYEELWGHAAAWLGVAGSGILFTVYSRGRGSSAAKAALLAVAFVLAERGLRWLWKKPALRRRARAFWRLAWGLYRHPLLAAGWVVSAGTIGLALIRNLLLLGGGRVQQTWAVAGLLLVVGLYAVSAWLFRRPRFVWWAAVVSFAPWTILANLGWFTAWRPTRPGFAIHWIGLAWLLFLIGLLVRRRAAPPYARPLRTMAHILLPFSLLWGVADVDTGCVTWGAAAALYGLAAWLDYARYQRADSGASLLRATRFLYPALGMVPVWCVYWMVQLLPGARHEHVGLFLACFGPLGLIAGRAMEDRLPLSRTARRAFALPAYLTGYVSLFVATLLVAHEVPLLVLVLLFDALLLVVSTWLFRHPLWLYPALVLVPFSLLLALGEAGVAIERRGWWLIGLAAVYLGLAWALRRLQLYAYRTGVLAVGLALVALGLPPSSRDQVGALWGYAGAALLYAITAFALGQPLLLLPACALSIVPYAVSLQRSALLAEYYGLALFPGAILALALGWALDMRFGRWRGFPWCRPFSWLAALVDRLLGWWGLPCYVLGFGLAMASPFFTAGRTMLAALNWGLLALVLGWGTWRFRLRGWLLATALAAQWAVAYWLRALGWWGYPDWAYMGFLPVTVLTLAAGLWIERRNGEGPPLARERWAVGWSRPLYLVVALDLVVGQCVGLRATGPGAAISLAHALLLAFLASVWGSRLLPYAGATLGAVSLWQWLAACASPRVRFPVALAQLALAYGVLGYGLALWKGEKSGRQLPRWLALWEVPLQRVGLVLSGLVWILMAWWGIDLAGWTVRAMLGLPFRDVVAPQTVWMVVGGLSYLGLLYLLIAIVRRRFRLGYGALGMLVAGWLLYAFYIRQWAGLSGVQWYALPAGIYLLALAFLEWRFGSRTLARWVDYAALALMLGSLFWQTLQLGWQYALLLGGEGFALLWWGSARRLRRFLYLGMVGVILAVLGQLINTLQAIRYGWIVYGVIGLLLLLLGAIGERKFEGIKSTLEHVLEDWE